MKQSIGAKTFMVPTPVLLVGSYNQDGSPNIMTAAWGGICSSQPPALAVSIRKNRLTYASIMKQRAFTVSIPSCSQAAQADYAGIKSGTEVDKFATLGLTPEHAQYVNAPYVAECPVVLELSLIQCVDIGSHTQFIGEIMDVKIDSDCLNESNQPNISKIDPMIFVPLLQEYHSMGKAVAKAFSAGLSVASKPFTKITKI